MSPTPAATFAVSFVKPGPTACPPRRQAVVALAGLGAAALGLSAWPARAQTPGAYPSRPIRLVVGFPPGGLIHPPQR
jgi:hypothetical protein